MQSILLDSAASSQLGTDFSKVIVAAGIIMAVFGFIRMGEARENGGGMTGPGISIAIGLAVIVIGGASWVTGAFNF